MKNQKLKTKEEYKKPYAFNKYFFGSGSDLDLSYDISEDMWNRIKFTHINLSVIGTITAICNPLVKINTLICVLYFKTITLTTKTTL